MNAPVSGAAEVHSNTFQQVAVDWCRTGGELGKSRDSKANVGAAHDARMHELTKESTVIKTLLPFKVVVRICVLGRTNLLICDLKSLSRNGAHRMSRSRFVRRRHVLNVGLGSTRDAVRAMMPDIGLSRGQGT